MPADLEAVIYVEEPPEIEVRNGLVFMRWTFGGMVIHRCMLPSTFARFLWRGEQVLTQFRSGANVVEFKRAEQEAAAH